MRFSVLLVVLTVTAVPVMAQSNDVAVWVGSSRVGTTDENGADIHFDRGRAYGASFNHFFGDHLSGELAAFSVRHDGTIRITGVNALNLGRLTMTPVSATAQFHLARASRFDAYAGAGAAYVRANHLHSSDLDTAGIGNVDIKSKVTWTALGGASFGFGRSLALAAEARYIAYEPDSGPPSDRVKLKLNPTTYSLGLRWRF